MICTLFVIHIKTCMRNLNILRLLANINIYWSNNLTFSLSCNKPWIIASNISKVLVNKYLFKINNKDMRATYVDVLSVPGAFIVDIEQVFGHRRRLSDLWNTFIRKYSSWFPIEINIRFKSFLVLLECIKKYKIFLKTLFSSWKRTFPAAKLVLY